jgi:hypothetical protein
MFHVKHRRKETLMGRRFTSVIGRLGIPTGDGRIISPGGLTSRDLPLPLSWQRESGEGHGGAVVVARMETIEFHQDMVLVTGHMLDVSGAWEAEELIEAGVIGPSMDLDDMTYVVDEEDRIVITSARVAGATLVSIPAFAEVSITLDPMPAEPTQVPESDWLMASVRSSGWSDMPIADESRAWDGPSAAGRVASWAGVNEDDAPDSAWNTYARAFLRKDDDADPHTKGAYGFGIADVVDGTLTIVPRGVFAAAAAVQGARTGSAPADADGMKRVLSGIYRRMDRTAPWDDSVQASATAQLPPLEYFTRPASVTPVTVDGDRVYGYVATWGTCHIGLPGCTTAPASSTAYAHFLRQEQVTSTGESLPVGVLTVGGGHADTSVGIIPAMSHYDDVGAAVARVFAGEDEHGIWVAGWVPPYADPDKVRMLSDLDVSGDWRRVGGNLELIAVCAVNTPGFPVLRKVHFSLGKGGQSTLIGQFKVAQPERENIEPVVDDARSSWARANWEVRGGA